MMAATNSIKATKWSIFQSDVSALNRGRDTEWARINDPHLPFIRVRTNRSDQAWSVRRHSSILLSWFRKWSQDSIFVRKALIFANSWCTRTCRDPKFFMFPDVIISAATTKLIHNNKFPLSWHVRNSEPVMGIWCCYESLHLANPILRQLVTNNQSASPYVTSTLVVAPFISPVTSINTVSIMGFDVWPLPPPKNVSPNWAIGTRTTLEWTLWPGVLFSAVLTTGTPVINKSPFDVIATVSPSRCEGKTRIIG